MQFFPVLRKAKQCLANIDFLPNSILLQLKPSKGGGKYIKLSHNENC